MCEKCVKSRKYKTNDILGMVDMIVGLGKKKEMENKNHSSKTNCSGELIPQPK